MAPQAAQVLTDRVKQKARELGFDTCGVTDLAPPPHGDALTRWLEHGMHGTMGYMERQAPKRLAPARIVPGATRAIMLTRNYYNPDPPLKRGSGRVAKYARGRDYHDALEAPLRDLCAFLAELGGPDTVARAYVDAGPVPERELAQRAGLGWIGKNTMLIDPDRGSFFFLAAVLTNLDLEPDPPFGTDHCGTCTRCLDACPTGAITEPWILDARRCISYLTIEHRGEIAPDLARQLGGWVFGCDICQDVCPWNQKFAREAGDSLLDLDPNLAQVDLRDLLEIDEDEFDRRFGRTPLTRPGREGMKRNARAYIPVG